jgi:phytoene synthase
MTLDEAYVHCRDVAKREAKNFYYAFRVLPKLKSDAMCAVYAFMRRADDIADDESKTLEQRRVIMAEWLDAWRASRGSGVDEQDAVFLALEDTQRRFGIPQELLEDLVRGTTMDLHPGDGLPGQSVDLGEGLQGYRTFGGLFRYCYLVASVVGLVCIRIFGYTDPAAELLAEKTGIAFQLTNILRDIKEDAERNRIYLPQAMLAEFKITNDDILALATSREMKANERALVVAISVQAWKYYKAARDLLPLIDADSRAALWVMVEIYSGLLGKIDEMGGDVFATRVKVSTREKLLVLLRGAAMSMRARTR